MASTCTWYSWQTARQDTQIEWNRHMMSMRSTQGLQVMAALRLEMIESSESCGQAEDRYE